VSVVGSPLKIDHYEVTMVQAALADGLASRRAVFEVFARRLPAGRRYGVLAGLGRLVEAIAELRFGPGALDYLRRAGVADDSTLSYLASFAFSGTIEAYREGELYFPYSPVLTVQSTFAEGLLLETLVLSVLNHDTAIASAAARMVDAAEGRPLIEMGSRRTDDEAAVSAARAAYVAGFAATSNLQAGWRYGVPTAGTASHAFTLAHDTEHQAFTSQLRSLGLGTTLLVDTYDIATGISTAVASARALGAPGPGAIRIDSGDLGYQALAARQLLDQLGAGDTQIVVSSDLDEFAIAELLAERAPIDSFGVGTRLATGSGHPTAGFVYKLVAIADGPGPDASLRAVAKRSAAKSSIGGRKLAFRGLDGHGYATSELVTVVHQPTGPPIRPDREPSLGTGTVSEADLHAHRAIDPGMGTRRGTDRDISLGVDVEAHRATDSGTDGNRGPALRTESRVSSGSFDGAGSRLRALQVPVIVDGVVVHRPDMAEIRCHHVRCRQELLPEHRLPDAGPPALTAQPDDPRKGAP